MTPPDKPNPADKDTNDPSSTKDAAVTAPSVPTPLETEEKMKFPKANQTENNYVDKLTGFSFF